MKSCVVLLALVAVAFCQWTDSSWTDSIDNGGFGGTLYLCFDDDEVNGAYSEYGIMQGSRSGDTIEGFWYEGGAGECIYGSYSLTIASDGLSFSGVWSCIEDDEEFDWSESFLGGSATTDDLSCAVLGSSSVDGSSVDGDFVFDICVDDDEYTASYEYDDNGTILGYEFGDSFENGLIVSGEYFEDNDASGISLVFYLRDGRIGNFYWEYDDSDVIDTLDLSLHGYDILTPNGNASTSECEINSFIVNENDDDDNSDDNNGDDDSDDENNDDDDSSTSDAVVLLCSSILVFVFAFA